MTRRLYHIGLDSFALRMAMMVVAEVGVQDDSSSSYNIHNNISNAEEELQVVG
jgi:hypothetical protein